MAVKQKLTGTVLSTEAEVVGLWPVEYMMPPHCHPRSLL